MNSQIDMTNKSETNKKTSKTINYSILEPDDNSNKNYLVRLSIDQLI